MATKKNRLNETQSTCYIDGKKNKNCTLIKFPYLDLWVNVLFQIEDVCKIEREDTKRRR